MMTCPDYLGFSNYAKAFCQNFNHDSYYTVIKEYSCFVEYTCAIVQNTNSSTSWHMMQLTSNKSPQLSISNVNTDQEIQLRT